MILTKMDHPNVITMLEYFESSNFISIIFDHIKGKPVLKMLEEYKEDYTTKRILNIISQLCKAIMHLKANDIIWCNFSHDNIIYDGESLKICGFSEARVKVSRDLKQAKSILGLRGSIFGTLIDVYSIFCNVLGNVRYASPEMILEKYYGLRHDVWGLGILCYVLFAGKFPFKGDTIPEICESILNDEPDFDLLRDRRVDTRIVSMIKGMLIKDPSKRSTIREVMANKIFSILELEESKVGNFII
jgi:serine/threonine protein kinase